MSTVITAAAREALGSNAAPFFFVIVQIYTAKCIASRRLLRQGRCGPSSEESASWRDARPPRGSGVGGLGDGGLDVLESIQSWCSDHHQAGITVVFHLCQVTMSQVEAKPSGPGLRTPTNTFNGLFFFFVQKRFYLFEIHLSPSSWIVPSSLSVPLIHSVCTP